jgi:hypothetical protein
MNANVSTEQTAHFGETELLQKRNIKFYSSTISGK